ncbi:UNVERIFIED_CONTAM: hypothetical protein FKN15_031285 [Acipenser sinensis]
MSARCPPKRVPSTARFFTLCRLIVQPPQRCSVGGQRSSGQITGKPSANNDPCEMHICAARAQLIPSAVWQFRNMIICVMPSSWPLLDFNNYGCYCGLGGSGTPVDELDRCCQVHDSCYNEALQHKDCWPIFDNPYTEIYSYTCREATVTCSLRLVFCVSLALQTDYSFIRSLTHDRNPDDPLIRGGFK